MKKHNYMMRLKIQQKTYILAIKKMKKELTIMLNFWLKLEMNMFYYKKKITS